MKHLLLSIVVFATFLIPPKAQGQLINSSLSSAAATIYLDFDGEYVNSLIWNNAEAFTALPAALTTAQKISIYKRVAEDFRPFVINVTTDEAVFLAAPIDKRIRVIVTPTSDWYSGVGGVSYIGSFTWGDDTPCFVFSDRLSNNTKYIAECCSHETGHALGLSHQSKYDGGCNLTATYNDGIGTGEAAWAPIMGNSYYRNMSGWNNGPTPYGCNNNQDNLTIITTQNGFTYRADDFVDDINTSPTSINITSFNVDGVISSNTDKDAFTFNITENSNVLLDVQPFSVGANNEGADLDIKVYLYNAAKNLIRTYDPATTMSVNIDTILSAGDYYLVIDGTGNINATDYGSIGSYALKGISSILPIKSVQLDGTIINKQHQLKWDIVNTSNDVILRIETATDGTHFNTLQNIQGATQQLLYTPIITGNIYYRLKMQSTQGQVKYSNTIILKNTENSNSKYIVTNIVHQQIQVQSIQPYQYQLLDFNGRTIATGNYQKGNSQIDVSNIPAGMYVLKLASNNMVEVKRILKQ
jgi:Secretion system C-terminal sorting domain